MKFWDRLRSQLNGMKQPVFWGNRHWYDYNEKLTSTGKVWRVNPNWINYKKLPGETTAHLLSDTHPEQKLRQRFHRECIQRSLSEVPSADRSQRLCIFTSGGTASGKTAAVDELLDILVELPPSGVLRIDYDRIKKMLPEYDLMVSLRIKEAASYVHSESSKLGAKLFKKAFQKGTPIIFEQTLENSKMPLEYFKDMRNKGYEVVIVATHATEVIGRERAAIRAARIGRYIPNDEIQRIYSGVPISLHEVRNKVDRIFLFDNRGNSLQLMYVKDSTGSTVVNMDLYSEYLTLVGNHLDLRL